MSSGIFRSSFNRTVEASNEDRHPSRLRNGHCEVRLWQQFQTRSTIAEIHTDICAACHPFYTGKQKLVDTAGRVERFRQKYEKKS